MSNNPEWPPEIGKPIMFRKLDENPNLDPLIGIVTGPISPGYKYIIALIDYPENYIDAFVKQNKNSISELKRLSSKLNTPLTVIDQGRVTWQYLSREDFLKIINDVQLHKFNTIETEIKNKGEFQTIKAIKNIYDNTPNTKKTPTNSVTHEGYNDSIDSRKSNNCNGKEALSLTYFLADNGEPNLNLLFDDNKLDVIFTDKKKPFTPSTDIQNKTLEELNKQNDIPKEDIKLVVNHNVALDNLIYYQEYEIDEGTKIMNWIYTTFTDKKSKYTKLIDGLELYVRNGYVHLYREGINPSDKLTPELFKEDPKLEFYSYMMNNPIDYNNLKHALLLNKFQESLDDDIKQLKEARLILSKEHLIAFQPDPIYLMWCVKRLILCWYADPVLQKLIRKMKILINIYRAKGSETHNQNHGVLPSILIYPKYGYESCKAVLTKLLQYFAMYFDKGWKCSAPTYFVKINNLIYYTNGDIDLKEYYRNTIYQSNKSLKNSSFNPSYTSTLDAKDVYTR